MKLAPGCRVKLTYNVHMSSCGMVAGLPQMANVVILLLCQLVHLACVAKYSLPSTTCSTWLLVVLVVQYYSNCVSIQLPPIVWHAAKVEKCRRGATMWEMSLHGAVAKHARVTHLEFCWYAGGQ